ncbi:AAA family ATPase [Bacillus sp. H-16]|uniref:AAA family ATPase n=1 Tax=Alteribacter salitolerans TaxID=2912333 RepID=UPI0019660116|nr:AAA family ATPase [Alteribacter salitolerans]
MIIKEINVYGFGKWTNESFTLDPHFQLVYGENEAGKSTLMSFIQAVFFGFPKKSDHHKSYEPLHHTTYGGSVVISTKEDGDIMIERVRKGRKKGDVTVKYSSGKTGGEDDLLEILDGYTEQVYRGIFSFDLMGLQGLEKMNAEEINSFLYDTSISGGPSLLSGEKEADEKMQSLFKPRGKVTPVNVTLKDLQKIEKEVNEWRSKLAGYEEISGKVELAEKELKETAGIKEKLDSKQAELDRLKKLLPLYADYKIIREQRKGNGEMTFPESGMNRLERSLKEKKELELQLTELHEKKSRLDEQRKNCQENQSSYNVKEIEGKVRQLNKQEGRYSEQLRSKQTLSEKIPPLIKQKKRIEADWGIEEERNFLHRDTTRQSEEELIRLNCLITESDQELERIKKEKIRLDEDRRRLEYELTESNKNLLNDQDKREIEGNLKTVQHYEAFKPQLSMLQHRLEVLRGQGSPKQQNNDNLSMLLFVIGGLLLLSGIWTIWTGSLFPGILTCLLGIVSIVIGVTRSKNKAEGTLEVELDQVQKEVSGWIEVENKVNNWPVSDWKMKLTLHEQAQHQKNQIERELRNLNRVCNGLTNEKENYQQRSNEALDELHRWAVTSGFDPGYTGEQYEEMFADTVKWKSLMMEEESVENELMSVTKQINSFIEEVSSTARPVGIIQSDEPGAMLYELDQWVRNQTKITAVLSDLDKEYSSLAARSEAILRRIKKEDEEITKLYEEAGVSTEESFRKKEAEWKMERQKQEEERTILAQMKAISPADRLESDWKRCDDISITIDEEIEQVLEEKKLNEERARQLVEDITTYRHLLKELEDGQSYEDCLQHYEMTRQKLLSLSKEWARYALAKDIIDKTKQIYEEKRQPAVLKGAESYFRQLTGDRYTKLFAPLGEAKFIVEREDGVRFSPGDLSQGTCELLYLSLRFSLAEQYQQTERFPIIIDEAFVNFDALRRKRVMEAVKKISAKHQVLYFTCHDHMIQESGSMKKILLGQTVSQR